MSKSIKCTNPMCDNLIHVPEGASQAICEHCNTWHFLEDNNAGSFNEQASNEQFNVPPPVNSNEQNDQWNASAVPTPIPDYQNNPVIPSSNGISIDEPQTKSDLKTPTGVLITDFGDRLKLNVGVNVIGRLNADLIVSDKSVSRRHCVVEISQSNDGTWEYYLYDIGHMEGKPSTNGVFVSGRSLRLIDYERVPIEHGSTFRIGKISLTLQIM